MITRQPKTANQLISEALIHSDADFQVISKVEEMKRGYVDAWHQHPWHQIIFPFEGIVQTKVADLQFVVPHSAMLFIPANTLHESFVMTDTKFIGIYLNPDINIQYPPTTKALSATPFLRELVLHINQILDGQKSQKDEMAKLVDVLIDQIGRADRYEMTLLLPTDRRLMLIFDALMANPQLEKNLADWAKEVGASQRTLSRLFTKQLGMSFPLWRQHLRLVGALNLLQSHCSIQEIAYRVGYQSDSSFIFAFKSVFKQTPQQYRNNGFMLSARMSEM